MVAVGDGNKSKTKSPEEPADVVPGILPLHFTVFRKIYVNDLGKDALVGPKTSSFPVGSIIVREALADFGSTGPQVIDAMVKRPEGFNPKGGDWEYMVFDGQGNFKKVTGPDNNCASCHQRQSKSDFVFRDGLVRSKDGA